MENNEILTKAGIDLAAIAVKNTAALVHDRIKTAKTKKDLKEQNNELQEIINDLLMDKAELLRVAQIYEQELASQKITDDDIKYITKNIFPILEKFMPGTKSESLEQIKSIFSKETLTILQLIGFNYKKAIGEPLTRLMGSFIESKVTKKPELEIDQNQALLAMMDLAKDEKAFNRFKEITSWGGKNEA